MGITFLSYVYYYISLHDNVSEQHWGGNTKEHQIGLKLFLCGKPSAPCFSDISVRRTIPWAFILQGPGGQADNFLLLLYRGRIYVELSICQELSQCWKSSGPIHSSSLMQASLGNVWKRVCMQNNYFIRRWVGVVKCLQESGSFFKISFPVFL